MPITADDLEKELQEELARKAKNAVKSNISSASWVPQRCQLLLITGVTCAALMFVIPQPVHFFSNTEFPTLEQTDSLSTLDMGKENHVANAAQDAFPQQSTELANGLTSGPFGDPVQPAEEAPGAARETYEQTQESDETATAISQELTSNIKKENKSEKVSFGGWKCSIGIGVARWREVLPSLFAKEGLEKKGDIYEFGVFNAQSMFLMRRFFPEARMWGFDSFEGLPDTKSDKHHSEWGKGAYRSSFRTAELVKKLGGSSKAGFVVGFYDKSLTPNLRKDRGMDQAMYVDMDADLYISSIQALEWIFKSGVVRKGTLVGYDDWWVIPCARGGEHLNPLNTSVGKAHIEIAKKYKVKFRCVAGPCSFTSCTRNHCCWGPIFLVESLGDAATLDHGFYMTNAEIRTWKAKNLECKNQHRFAITP